MSLLYLSIFIVRMLAIWVLIKGLEPLLFSTLGFLGLMSAAGAMQLFFGRGVVFALIAIALFRYSERLGRWMASIDTEEAAARIESPLAFHDGLRLAISVVGLCVAAFAIPDVVNGVFQAWVRAGVTELPDALGRPRVEFFPPGVTLGLVGYLIKFAFGVWIFLRPDFLLRWVNPRPSEGDDRPQ